MEIIYVKHSIANRFNGYIELNENLKKYPELFKPILKHELSHTDKPWSKEDFVLDFFSNSNVNFWKLIKFMLKYPKSFLQLSPIIYSKEKKFIYDINLLIMYLSMFMVFLSVLYLGVKFL